MKHRIRTFVIAFVLMFLVFLVWYCQDKQLLPRFIRYITEDGYAERICESDPFGCTYGNKPKELFALLARGYEQFSDDLSSTISIYQVFLPIISVIGGAMFYREWNVIDKFKMHRHQSRVKTEFALMSANATAVALGVFVAYLLTMWLCYTTAWFKKPYPGADPYSDFLLDLIPIEFYEQHIVLYWILLGVFHFFAATWIYCLFSSAIALYCKSMKTTVLLPLSIFYGLIFANTWLCRSFGYFMIYLNPIGILASMVFPDRSSLLFMAFPLATCLISMAMVKIHCDYEEI